MKTIMKTTKTAIKIGVVIIAIFFNSCDSEVHITNPKIFNNPIEPYLLDTVTTEVVAEVEIDGAISEIEKYDWIIIDQDGNEHLPITNNGNIITWLPSKVGLYTIEVTLSVGNKSLTEIEKLNVEFQGPYVTKYFSGIWRATIFNEDGARWVSDFQIESNGRYSAKIDSILEGEVLSAIGFGNNEYVNDSCTMMVYDYLGDNLYGGFIYYLLEPLEGHSASWGYGFMNNIQFSNNYRTINFEVDYELGDGTEIVTYELEKQD